VSEPSAEHAVRPEPEPPSHETTSAVTGRARFALIWLVPIVAAALVVYLGYSSFVKRGPEITIRFKTADGLVAQQTVLKYKAVPLGMVEDIDLGQDHASVVVHVRTDRSARFLLSDHARFWVVRPRLSVASISGLETLVSGAYIAADPGEHGGKPARAFTGLEEPPGVTSDEPGRTFDLKATRLGSLGAGAPVFYRDVTVGSMLKYDLGDGLGPVSLRIFIRAPYDKLVHPDTLFWNASGVSLTTGSDGLHLELESIQSLLMGGIAFETPRDGDNVSVAESTTPFHLFESKAKADAGFFRKETACLAYFQTSVQGLERGSAVQIFGVQIGAVKEVRLVLEPSSRRLLARVAFDLQPDRMRKPGEYRGLSPPDLRPLVAEGLRVVIESSNLLTGQRVLSLEYVPNAKAGALTEEGDAIVLPSQAGGLDGITVALADIAAKLDRIPFDEIGDSVNATLRSLRETIGGPDLKSAVATLSATMKDVRHLVHEADTDLPPALGRLPAIAGELQAALERTRDALGAGGYGVNSDVQRGLARMMSQVGDAARTVRLLADFLDHHPEALLRGRTAHVGER